jgi:hypothetical protein
MGIVIERAVPKWRPELVGCGHVQISLIGAANGEASATPEDSAERRLHARLAGVMRSQPVIGLGQIVLCRGVALPRVAPFWQAGLAQDCWGHVLASRGTVSAVAA